MTQTTTNWTDDPAFKAQVAKNLIEMRKDLPDNPVAQANITRALAMLYTNTVLPELPPPQPLSYSTLDVMRALAIPLCLPIIFSFIIGLVVTWITASGSLGAFVMLIALILFVLRAIWKIEA